MFGQSYRRFQVNFACASDAVQFIEAIRPVCPCKEHAGPPPPQISTIRTPTPMSTSIQAPSSGAPLVRSHTSVSHQPSMPPPSADATRTMGPAIPLHYQSSQEEPSQKKPHFLPPSSSEFSIVPSSDPAPLLPSSASGFDKLSQPSSTVPEMHSSQFATQSRGCGGTSSLPASSQSTLSSGVTLTQPSHALEKTRDAFLESLRDTPELYSLTRAELENLVSVVVREPGFPRLLEALDSMWVIRGFLGR